MQVQKVNNQQSFGMIRLPGYCTESTRDIARKVDTKFKPGGVVNKLMVFKNLKEEELAYDMFLDAGITVERIGAAIPTWGPPLKNPR